MSDKKRYVKLGEKALSFYDPISGLSITTGEAVELTVTHRQSRRVIKALKSGHIENVDSEELDNYIIIDADGAVEKPEEEPAEEKGWKDAVEYNEKYLNKLKVAQLRELAAEYLDWTEAEIAEATKNEIILALLEIEWEED